MIRHVSDIDRTLRNNRLMAELFSPAYLPDPRSFVPQQRIDHFRRQRMSLEQHQVKSNDELACIDELFSQ
uniref:Transposase n=1 Tax=Globodera pallida TaxID=36090 RepID=A0A183C204_GLOPA